MDPITIDTTVTFTLAAGKDGKPRVAVVEAGELSDLTTLLWETKTAKDEKTGKDILPWPVIEEAVTAFFLERTGITLSKWESRLIWDQAGPVWEKKRASYREPEKPAPICAPSTDPRYSDAA
jgi:hypothetical protein